MCADASVEYARTRKRRACRGPHLSVCDARHSTDALYAVDGRAPYHSGMVRIRLFAALREAAGVPEVEAGAAPLQAILDELGDRFGDRFVAILGYSSVLVDGERWRDPSAPVPDGAELALLPPFSGGA
jgi:sulfur-carrier protein